MATDTSIQQQIVREAPEIEAYKLDLLEQARALAYNQIPQRDEKGNVVRDALGRVQYTAAPKTLAEQLPGYEVAGFSPAQQAAMRAAEQQGVGAFSPYVQAANIGLGGAMATTREAGDILRGADTRGQFADAQAAMRQAGAAASGISGGIGQINTGLGYMDLAGQRALASDTTGRLGAAYQDIGTGVNALATAQNMAARASQADLTPATATMAQGIGGLTDAQRMTARAAGADFSGSQGLIGSSLGGFDPSRTQSFMDPYRQQVIDEAMRQISRQGAIAQQGLSAQAVRSGAFGGAREGVQRAELERGLLEQKSNTIANLLSQGYSQAQANAMATFEQQQQRGMQAGQVVGQQAAQQAQLGQAAAGLYGNLSQNQVAAGQALGQLGVEQARLGQSAAGLYQQAAQGYGNLASQQGALAGQESNIQQNISNLLMQQGANRTAAAQALAGIYGQQSGQFQNIGQGIGALAGQQFGVGQNIAQNLGQLGQQYGQQAINQLGIGQAAQGMQQSDINFLYNVGQAQQAFRQQQADAERATYMQRLYAPYQQAGFLSDIYRGAPSTQMATTAVSQPAASPFQTAAGIGIGGLTAAAGAAKAGLFGPP